MAATDATTSGLRLKTPIHELGVVHSRAVPGYARLGIRTVADLVRHLPVKYEKQYAECHIRELPLERVAATRGLIVATRMVPPGGFRRARRGPKPRFEATLEDSSGRLIVNWFNAPYLKDRLYPGLTLRVRGKIAKYQGKVQMTQPQWELIEEPDQTPMQPQRLRPIYRATEQLSSPAIEKITSYVLPHVLNQLVDPLPEEMRRAHAMVSLAQAYQMAHQPQEEEETSAARRRLAFNELLLLQLGISLKRKYNETKLAAPALRWSEAIDQHIRDRFPFKLTEAQDLVIADLKSDLQLTRPMNRLVQGDVGAGKTVIALYALLMAVANRKQGAMMAPTDLLAEQHYLSISNMLSGSNVRIALLSGRLAASGSAQRAALMSAISQGQYDIVIGTQALIGQSDSFQDLAVIVIDEQHRFGVLQRAAMRTDKNDQEGTTSPLAQFFCPHCLVMTATPIPRTLSLTVFGDLDVSTIKGLPPGRTPITSRVVSPEKSDQVYVHVAERLKQGEQAYVVVPAIDQDPASTNENGHDRTATAKQLKNVRAHARLLEEKYLAGLSVGIIHGRMKRTTRGAVMDRFRRGKIDCLVATTVIEVGVDVPNATLMVIEHAERFGLAQLHQLRGRIGRGSDGKRSLCVFIAEPTTEEATKRLDAIASTSDGFQIAEHDLAIRGMGDFFGTRQHGMPPLRVARIPEDSGLLRLARRDAQTMVDADPTLTEPLHRGLRQVLIQQYGEMLGLIDVG